MGRGLWLGGRQPCSCRVRPGLPRYTHFLSHAILQTAQETERSLMHLLYLFALVSPAPHIWPLPLSWHLSFPIHVIHPGLSLQFPPSNQSGSGSPYEHSHLYCPPSWAYAFPNQTLSFHFALALNEGPDSPELLLGPLKITLEVCTLSHFEKESSIIRKLYPWKDDEKLIWGISLFCFALMRHSLNYVWDKTEMYYQEQPRSGKPSPGSRTWRNLNRIPERSLYEKYEVKFNAKILRVNNEGGQKVEVRSGRKTHRE